MANYTISELYPIHDSRKSFYGKAKVVTEGNLISLYSYDRLIETLDMESGELTKTEYYNYSVTTRRHQREFERQRGLIPAA